MSLKKILKSPETGHFRWS